MENEYKCKICNYSTKNKYGYNNHSTNKEHLYREELNKYCMLCNKTFKTKQIYWQHRKKTHTENNINNINIKKNKIKSININNKLDDMNTNMTKNINNAKNEIKNEINDVKEEIKNSNKEVVTVVNKAITKASSLIKYLMENHKSVPPLKKIKKHECIDKLRIDYKCPENKNDYSLQINMIKDYSKNLFIPNIAKTILSIVNNKDTEKQPIYNTDCSRYNYVIKITSNNWDEDKSGIKFTDYVIRPLLKYIRDLNEEYIENILEKVDMYRQNYYENEKLVYLKNDAYKFDLELTNDYLIKPILKELAPHLRFIYRELEEMEKLEELEQIQEELQEFINNNDDNNNQIEKPKKKNKINNNNVINQSNTYKSNTDTDTDTYDNHNKMDDDYNDDDYNDNYIKKINKRLINK